MKTINEILILVKKEFNECEYICISYSGLCHVSDNLENEEVLTEGDHRTFSDYIKNSLVNREYYYECNGKRLNNSSWFYVWKPEQKCFRNKWLDKHIKLTS